jgi:phage terminase large subunit-like protein
MAAPVRELKRAIMAGAFRHGGNPILRMNFANVTAERDAAENEKFTKARATGRIDGCVAAAMAVGVILSNDQGPSVYATGERPDGFLWI